MRPWPESWHCLSRAHCPTCRARTEAGRRWRAGIAAVYEPPPGWECPHGRRWDYTEPWLRRALRRWKLGSKVERVTRAVGVKPCGGCLKRKAILDGETPPQKR